MQPSLLTSGVNACWAGMQFRTGNLIEVLCIYPIRILNLIKEGKKILGGLLNVF